MTKEKLIKHLVMKVLGIEDIPDNIEIVSRNSYFNNEENTLVISYNDGSEPIEINLYEFIYRILNTIKYKNEGEE